MVRGHWEGEGVSALTELHEEANGGRVVDADHPRDVRVAELWGGGG